MDTDFSIPSNETDPGDIKKQVAKIGACVAVVWTVLLALSWLTVAHPARMDDDMVRKTLLMHGVIWICSLAGTVLFTRWLCERIQRDRSIRTAAERALAVSQTILAKIPCGLVIIDENQIVRQANAEAVRMMGLPEGSNF